jgi:hypothetical protein
LDKVDQFTLVRNQFGMAGGDRSAEVGHRLRTLMKNGTETDPQSIALDGDLLVEVGQL